MPADVLDARVSSLCLSEVLGRFERFSTGESDGPEMFPWAERFVMGFPLPSWQRPLVWTQAQKIRFARANIKSWDEAQLRLAYDLRAFGGTPHTEAQRAVNEQSI